MTKWYYGGKLGLRSTEFLVRPEEGEHTFVVVGEDCARELVDVLNQLEADKNIYEQLWHGESCTAGSECGVCGWDEEE